jgi:glycosyltransferase involved in cell wall biosynthesis
MDKVSAMIPTYNRFKTYMDKVSVIIPTYNRFKYVLHTIKSVKEQTYPNIEIIVVNDHSTEKEYYEYDWKENNIIMIHLEQNTKKKFGYVCTNFVRNTGIERASGAYIAFCDDDDIWFPNKIENQIKSMQETGCKMSSTDGLIGNGVFDNKKIYEKYNAEHYYKPLQDIYKRKGSDLLHHGFPKIWNLDFLKIHNCMICSSVVIEKNILDKINNMRCIKNGGEDYDCWLQVLEHTDSVYVEDICFYYDSGHGYGSNY